MLQRVKRPNAVWTARSSKRQEATIRTGNIMDSDNKQKSCGSCLTTKAGLGNGYTGV